MISLHKNILWPGIIISLITLLTLQISAQTIQAASSEEQIDLIQAAPTVQQIGLIQAAPSEEQIDFMQVPYEAQITQVSQVTPANQIVKTAQSLMNKKGEKLLAAKRFKINGNKIWHYFKDNSLKQYLKDSLKVMEKRCADILKSAYMAQNLIEIKSDIPGWEGYPVGLYEYYTGKDIKINRPKKGKVLMLNPSARQLALWIITAVMEAKGSLNYNDLNKVANFIKWQSGAQFPVSGVVYEDMYTKGFYEPYVFKDGVTVYVANSNMFPKDKTCTEEQLDFYLNLKNSDLKPNTGRYARICSTNRDMYYAAGGTEEVGDNNDNRKQEWLGVVRKLYQKAWNAPTSTMTGAYTGQLRR